MARIAYLGHRLCGMALALIFFGTTGEAAAPQNLQWSGSGNWIDPGQWLTPGNTLTTFNSSSPDNATFSTTGNLSVPLGGNVTVGTISFTANAKTGFAINDLTSTMTINGGITLADRATTATESIKPASITLAADQTWTVGNNYTLSVPTTISGSGRALTKDGSGTLILGAANTFSGGLIINAGTVQLAAASSVPSAALTFTGSGTLDLNGVPVAIASLSGQNGSIINTASGGTSLRVTHAGNITYGGTLADGGSGKTLIFDKRGAGTLTLTGNNSYSGGTAIRDGVLQVGNGGNSGSVGSGAINLANANGILAVNRSDTLSINSQISGSGGVKVLGGTLALGANNNSYSGGTTLVGGTLSTTSSGALPANGSITMASGATLALNSTTAGTVGALTLQAASSGPSSWTLQLNPGGNAGSITFSSLLSYPGSGNLKINGWSGSAHGSGTDDRIFFGTAPDPTFLNNLLWYDQTGQTLQFTGGFMGANGELEPNAVATPEPANIALALFGATWLLIQITRLRRSR